MFVAHQLGARSYIVLCLASKETIGIVAAIDVEANQVSIVVEAIDSCGANAVWVVDGLPASMVQWAGQQKPMHLGCVTAPNGVETDDLVMVVDAEERCVGHIRHTHEVKLSDGVVLQQEAVRCDIAIGVGSDNISVVVDARCHRTLGTMDAARANFNEFVLVDIQLVSMVVAVVVSIEANCYALIVDTQQLVDLHTI